MPKAIIDKYPGLPSHHGLAAVSLDVHNGCDVMISIVGDKEGLHYLADVITYMANLDVRKKNLPSDGRAHITLSPGSQLIQNSFRVEICRAEAKGSGELPDYFPQKKTRRLAKGK